MSSVSVTFVVYLGSIHSFRVLRVAHISGSYDLHLLWFIDVMVLDIYAYLVPAMIGVVLFLAYGTRQV